MNRASVRIAVAGSVDDGKSTLVGRLLYDSKSLLDDHLTTVERPGADHVLVEADLGLLTDGLRSEREQGITIDVAYRYFATPDRSFVIADCPGHVQYTRNAVTGMSRADAVVLLVDVGNGVVEQTRRHAVVAALLRVPVVVFAINKMDTVRDGEVRFDRIREELLALTSKLGCDDAHFVPVSALRGTNVVRRPDPELDPMPWYHGPALLGLLEAVDPASEHDLGFRMPVQAAVRPGSSAVTPDLVGFRGVAGTVASGTVRVGDRVIALSSGLTTTVASIRLPSGGADVAWAGRAVVLSLADPIDVGRGDVLAGADDPPISTTTFNALVACVADVVLEAGHRLLVKHGTNVVPAILDKIVGAVDLAALQVSTAETIQMNDIAAVSLRVADPIPVEPYVRSRAQGAFLLIDDTTGATLAAGVVGDPLGVTTADGVCA